MARRKSRATGRRRFRSRREQRIRIEPTPDRPFKVDPRSLLKRELIKNTDPFTIHRRGPRREKVGEDELEARAVPKTQVKGTLPERIVYKFLIKTLRMMPGIDFTFQSSFQGGRLELGGIVADFVFPVYMIVIRVQGPTHNQYLRSRKDEEQESALADLGYTTVDIEMEEIFVEQLLEAKLRRVFGFNTQKGHGSYDAETMFHIATDLQPFYVQLDRKLSIVENNLNVIR